MDRAQCALPSTVPVAIHLALKKLPVLDLKVSESCIMAKKLKEKRIATLLKMTGQINNLKKFQFVENFWPL